MFFVARMNSRDLGMMLVALGVALALVGVLVATGALGWFGRLPGDIRYERGNVRVYAPLASGLLLGAVLSLGLFVIRRFF